MKYINMSIGYLFYEVFIFILEIKVALISHSWPKASSKAAENKRLITLPEWHKENSPVTQTNLELTMLSMGGWPH